MLVRWVWGIGSPDRLVISDPTAVLQHGKGCKD